MRRGVSLRMTCRQRFSEMEALTLDCSVPVPRPPRRCPDSGIGQNRDWHNTFKLFVVLCKLESQTEALRRLYEVAQDQQGLSLPSRRRLPALRRTPIPIMCRLATGFGNTGAFIDSRCFRIRPVLNFARSHALEVGRHGIRVNGVAPGWILTDGTRSLF